MAITTEIKRNCLDGIHSNVLSLSHQILFSMIVALITIKYLELKISRLTQIISNPTKLNTAYEYLSVWNVIEYFRFSYFVPDTCNPKNELKGKFHHKL